MNVFIGHGFGHGCSLDLETAILVIVCRLIIEGAGHREPPIEAIQWSTGLFAGHRGTSIAFSVDGWNPVRLLIDAELAFVRFVMDPLSSFIRDRWVGASV